MCTTVIFQYKCGCSEPVVFECPFSAPPISSSGSSSSPSENLRAQAHQNCSKRYRLQQEKLFSSSKRSGQTTSNLSSPHAKPSGCAGTPVSPFPKPTCLQIEKAEEHSLGETPVTELDELCHDCWQHELQLAKQSEDEDTAVTEEGDEEEGNRVQVNARILREISPNELVISPNIANINVNMTPMSSARSFPSN